MIEPDLRHAQGFVDLIAEGEPLTFQTFADRGAKGALAKIRHGAVADHAAELARLNAQGAGVFFMVNAGDGKGRQARNVTAVRALFVDLDGAPVHPVLDAPLAPHLVVESSPGRFHGYWLVRDCPLDQFASLQKALAARFDGDRSVNDLPRVMRLPGFVHHKGDPFMSRLVQSTAAQPYALAELTQRLGVQASAQASTGRKSRGGRAPSASEPTFAAGGRNAALASIAGRMRRDGLSEQAIEAALQSTNAERCVPPLGEDEVQAIARSIGRYSAGVLRASVAPVAAGGAFTWPEPLLPGTSRVPEIDPALLGGWLGDMAATVAASTQTPPAMAVMTALAVVAAVVQRQFEVAPYGDDYREPLALWTMVVLGPGNRKSAVHKALTQVIVDIEKREGDRLRREIARVGAERDVIAKRMDTLKAQAGKEDDAKARQHLQDQIAALREQMPNELFAPRIFTGDVTAERLQQLLVEQGERIAVLSDEGGIFSIMGGAYSGGMGSFDVFLQGHAGSAMRVDRAGRLAHIDRPCLTIGLALQPGILQDTGKARKFRDSGLMARFVYVVPRSTVGVRDVRARIAVDGDARRRYEAGIEALYAGVAQRNGSPRVLPFGDAARERWLDLCEDIEQRQGEGGRYAHMADWTSKLPGAAARIAAVLALAEGGTELAEVSESAVARAVQLARLLVPHAEAAFALMGASDHEADAHAVLALLQRHQLQTVVRRDLQKSMEGRFRQLDRLLAAVKLLQDWHILGPERKTSGAGRPSVYYEVNPRLYVDKSNSSPRSE